MATYKQIFGKAIKSLASDPSAEGLGQIWYNTVSNTYKTFLNPAAWSSAPVLNTARDSMSTARQGTTTAALCYGGHTAGPPPTSEGARNLTESYNGTAWTAVNTLPAAKQLAGGAGTQAAALCFGGATWPSNVKTATTESWDGTNWTAVNAMNTARHIGNGAAGTQGAALGFGGPAYPSPGYLTATEEFDGTNWTTSPGSMNTPRADITGTGLQTAAVAFGGTGYPPGTFVVTITESYDGSTWTSQGAMNTARRRAGGGGPSAAAVGFGGLVPGPAATTSTETFDGSSWTAASAMGTGRYYLGGAGATATDSMAMGGLTSGVATSYTNLTEEYTQGPAVKTITTS
tara:strand:+ start:780 stop:1814 length:1035 start_codon:yes stop_codon:yes gene_type:complete